MSSVFFGNIHQQTYKARSSIFNQSKENERTESEKLAEREKTYQTWEHDVKSVGSDLPIFGLRQDRSSTLLNEYRKHDMVDVADNTGAGGSAFIGNDEDQVEDSRFVADNGDDDDDEGELDDGLESDEYELLDELDAPQDQSSNMASPHRADASYRNMASGFDDEEDGMMLD